VPGMRRLSAFGRGQTTMPEFGILPENMVFSFRNRISADSVLH